MIKLSYNTITDEEELHIAIEDHSPGNEHFWDTETGKVIMLSNEFSDDYAERIEEMENDHYIRIPQVSSYIVYEWMEKFIEQKVADADPNMADKLRIAVNGKGAFRRFKDVLADSAGDWREQWFTWKNQCMRKELEEWLTDLPIDCKLI